MAAMAGSNRPRSWLVAAGSGLACTVDRPRRTLYARTQGRDLSLALPLTAASYPLAALLARFYLREDVGTARWIGTLVITAGVAIVAWGDR